jgi:hypothetical protein
MDCFWANVLVVSMDGLRPGIGFRSSLYLFRVFALKARLANRGPRQAIFACWGGKTARSVGAAGGLLYVIVRSFAGDDDVVDVAFA